MKFKTKAFENSVAKGVAMTLISMGMRFEAIPQDGGTVTLIVDQNALHYLPSDADATIFEISDDVAKARGEALAKAFDLKRDTEHRDQFRTAHGSKRAAGVFDIAHHIMSMGN